MTRYLTDEEIDNILDFIKPNKTIPIDTAMSIVKITKDKYIKQLKKQKVYPRIIPELKQNIEKNHIQSLIHPGESVGIIAAQSIGERQTQNSIAYDELVVIKDHNKIKRIKIGKFIDDYIKLFDYYEINESHVQNCENVFILTVSSDEKIEWKRITEVCRHKPKGDLLKVTTNSGRNVVSTFSHSHILGQPHFL
jgi:SOS-response transcriptional repressor LexA